MNGKLVFGESYILTGGDTLNPRVPVPARRFGLRTLSPANFELIAIGGGIALPYWLLVITFAATTTLPWLRWRFSLRTLLIATTLVAIVLGLVVWNSG
jgi:hypothetical protein